MCPLLYTNTKAVIEEYNGFKQHSANLSGNEIALAYINVDCNNNELSNSNIKNILLSI